MIAEELISNEIPPLKTSDSGLKAMAWMEEFRISHLPIVNHQELLGVISEEDIFNLNSPEEPLGNHRLSLYKPYVKSSQHIYEVIRVVAQMNLSLVPVLDDKENYLEIITSLFNHFNLEFSVDKNLIKGDSTSEDIKNEIRKFNFFDVVYIDGCHDYNCVVSDILLMKEVTKLNSIIVFDDSSCFKQIPENNFKGHIDVCNAIKDYLENDSMFIEILCVGHNRVFKRIE